MSLKKKADEIIAMPIVHWDPELNVLVSRISELEAAIESALKVVDLWLPLSGVTGENLGEAKALYSMRDLFSDMVAED